LQLKTRRSLPASCPYGRTIEPAANLLVRRRCGEHACSLDAPGRLAGASCFACMRRLR
jgi:hypothetical protein